MGYPHFAGGIAKAATSKKRPRRFWNIFFSLLIAVLLFCASYLVYCICTSSGEALVSVIVVLSVFAVPAIGFCVFMLVVTNIKNPSRKIDKLQREYLLRFYDESGKMK